MPLGEILGSSHKDSRPRSFGQNHLTYRSGTRFAYSDEDAQSNHDCGNQKLGPRGSLVRECGIAHDEHGIDHGKLIGELHLI